MGFSENAFWQGSTWLGQYNYDVIQLLQRSLSHAFGCHGWVVQIWKHIICMVSLPRLPYFKRRIHGRQTCLFYHDRVFEFRWLGANASYRLLNCHSSYDCSLTPTVPTQIESSDTAQCQWEWSPCSVAWISAIMILCIPPKSVLPRLNGKSACDSSNPGVVGTPTQDINRQSCVLPSILLKISFPLTWFTDMTLQQRLLH